LPETIGYIACAKNPLRFASVLRILHGTRSPLSLPSRGNGRKNMAKSVDKSMQSPV
jgi:hypothetical protein